MRIAAGSSEPILEELYRLHRGRALAVARRILRDGEEAEDVVQDVFLRLACAHGSFRGRAAYATWLHRVVVNSSIGHLRGLGRWARPGPAPDPPLTPEEEAYGSQLSALLEEALAELRDTQRHALVLRELRGRSYPEIAALLGLPEGTVKSALHRARDRVRRALREAGVEVAGQAGREAAHSSDLAPTK